MRYGQFSEEQRNAIKPFIRGRIVYDLGCGDGHLSVDMAELGARRVVAVDTTHRRFRAQHEKVDHVCANFTTYQKIRTKAALVSWPYVTHTPNLAALIKQIPTVIYLGSTMDGTWCGAPDFWLSVMIREVLAHVPDRRNSLIVYGPKQLTRALLAEEFAALDVRRTWSFDKTYPEHAKKSKSVALDLRFSI